jgi:hypothetical protein
MFLHNCPFTPTAAESHAIGGFELIETAMAAALETAYTKEERGVDGTVNYDFANDLMILNLHFAIAEYRNDGSLTLTEMKENYKVDCIRKTMALQGFDIDPLLNYYGLTTASVDGINYMDIEGEDNDFIVEKP